MLQSNVKLADRIADVIRKDIIEGTYKNGEKLPNEFQLAEALGVGRGTIREAVKILVSKNILYIKRGHGTYVTKSPGKVNDPLGLAFSEDKGKISADLCEIRLLLEPQIAALAAERASDQEIKNIRDKCSKVEELILEGVPHVEADVEFHEAIAEASHNDVVSRIVPIIQESIVVFIKMTNSELRDMTLKTHNMIVEAIEKRDSTSAAKAMREHLEQNQKHIMRVDTL